MWFAGLFNNPITNLIIWLIHPETCTCGLSDTKSKPCESKGNYIQFNPIILSLFQKSSLGFFFAQIDNLNIWQVNKNWVLHACSAHVASATSMWNMHQLTRTNNACKLHASLLKSSHSLPFPAVVLAKCAYDKSQTKYSTQKPYLPGRRSKIREEFQTVFVFLVSLSKWASATSTQKRLFLFRLLMSTIHTRWLSFSIYFTST